MTPLELAKATLAALELPARPQRAELRRLAGPILDGLDRAEIKHAFDASPLIGDAPTQINPRATPAGIRDNLGTDVLVGLIAWRVTPATGFYISGVNLLFAISNPTLHGWANKRSKTGYEFGRPSDWEDHHPDVAIKAIREYVRDNAPASASPSATQGAKAMIHREANLSCALAIYDRTMDWVRRDLAGDAEAINKLRQACLEAIEAGFGGEIGIAVVAAADADATPGVQPGGFADDAERKRQFVAGWMETAVAQLRDKQPSTPAPAPARYPLPAGDKRTLINLTLGQSGLPDIETLLGEMDTLAGELAQAKQRSGLTITVGDGAKAIEVAGQGRALPAGKVVLAKASEVFGVDVALSVPRWEWEGEHPHVPEIDEGYIFRKDELVRVLYALVTNQRAYLHGHTGTGKSTLVEQVAARLRWPMMRVNFDSEVTRMDLIGRDVLTTEGTATVSRFVDGVLPTMMSGPYIGLFDELDFVRPDVAYVMQRALEGNGLVVTEDGGRVVTPHPMFRMVATGNTAGQGDEFGMYQGARPQSLALLDRFTVWAKVDYLDEGERVQLIRRHAPELESDMVAKISQYVGEHLVAFTGAQVMQPISPRSFVSFARAVSHMLELLGQGQREEALKLALEMSLLDRASAQDRAVLHGIAGRVFAL